MILHEKLDKVIDYRKVYKYYHFVYVLCVYNLIALV